MNDGVRSEVVQAIVAAVANPSPAALQQLAALESITPEERAAADSLTLSLLPIQGERDARTFEVLAILWGESPGAAQKSWSQLFDEVTEADVDWLRNLYDAMPDEARMEFDSRYGRPQL